MSSSQVNVAQDKEQHPERYCPVRRCLWRTDDRAKYPDGRCPRHRFETNCDGVEADPVYPEGWNS